MLLLLLVLVLVLVLVLERLPRDDDENEDEDKGYRPRAYHVYLSGMPHPLQPVKLLRSPVFWLEVAVLTALVAALGSAKLRSRPGAVPRQSQRDAQEVSFREAVRAAPEDPRPRARLVRYLLAVGRRSDAVDIAREARAAFPESVPVGAVLAEALAAAGRVPEAIDVLRPLAAIGPEYRLKTATYLIREGKRAEAVRLLDGLGSVPADLALQTGLAYLDVFQPEAAARLFRKAAAGSAASGDAWSHLGFALLLSARYQEAVTALERALPLVGDAPALHAYLGSALRLSGDLKRLPEAEAHLRRAVELTPQEALFHYELALSRAQLRDRENAGASLERAAELAPTIPEMQHDLARFYERTGSPPKAAIARSRYLRLLDDAPAAVRLLTPLQQKNPQDLELARALAGAHLDARQYPQALALMSGLRDREPRSTELLWDAYQIQDSLHDDAKALQVLDSLASTSPGDPNVIKARADALLHLQRYEEAERELARLRDMEPADPARHYDLGAFQILWSPRPDRMQAAETALRKTLELQPNHKGAHCQLALLLQRTGRAAEATAHLRRAVDLDPAYADAYRLLGQAYALQGDTARSEEMFRIYRRLQAQQAEQTRLERPAEQGRATRETRFRLASFYVAHGRLSEAIRELEALMHFAPRDRPARELLVRLYGSARRFQRQFEERDALSGTTQ